MYNSIKTVYISYYVHKAASIERNSSMNNKEVLHALFMLCNTSLNDTLQISCSLTPRTFVEINISR